MSQETYFQSYIQIISQGIKAIRKISFKKINVVNQLITKLQNFLAKQVYGRIKPTNYLLLFLIALGGRNTKLYPPIILTIQKLFANNYIAPDEQLSGSIQFFKQQYKQFLFLPYVDYSKKTFQEIYIQTLVALPDKVELINLLISKNMSLIFRLSQSNLPTSLIPTICDFFIDVILQCKSDQYDKILKSTFLEIVRHSIQSLKQTTDRRLLDNDQQISIKKLCYRYGAVLADQVAIQLNVQKNCQVSNYSVVPSKNQEQGLAKFKLFQFEQINQKNEPNGKFGWCAVCRKAANYYCRVERIPVCSYKCKQLNFFQTRNLFFYLEQLEKFINQENRSLTIFTSHFQQFCKTFSKYLSHPDIRKRTAFADTFIHLSSQIKKINLRNVSQTINDSFQDIFKQCCINLVMQTQAFAACAVVIKKLIPLNIFAAQSQILLHELAKKLTHFMTPINIKEQTLKLIRDLIKSQALFQSFMEIDCDPERKDSVHQVINAISKIYVGITPPQGITNLPPQDPNTRKFCYDILCLIQKGIKSINQNKILISEEALQLQKTKKQKNLLKSAIKRFNKAQKPTKIIKKLISQKFFGKHPKIIAQFLHTHLKKLNFVNIGHLIGDHDPLGISIRDQYIHQMQFKSHLVDQGMRILLSHFTIPGQSQVVDRIIDSFSKQYFKQNLGQQVFLHSDAVYSFSYLLMMLQTNLHNPQVIQKMTLQQFSNLSKDMNGKGTVFPQDFLQKIYTSIQKNQLGFHSMKQQIQIINAYQKSDIKKAQQIHMKHLQTRLGKQYLHTIPENVGGNKYDKIDVKLLISQSFGPIIQAVCVKIRETQQKQELNKCIQLIQQMLKYSLSYNIQQFVAIVIKNIWQQISKTITIKKYILTQKIYIWVRQFAAHVYDQWSTIINSFSLFYRSKAIKKDNVNKNSIMVVVQDKCYLYDSYIQAILSKCSKFNYTNLNYLIDALIESSKQEIADSQVTFCLQKIGDVFEYNNSRLSDIVPLTWNKLKQHYIQLGKHKIQKVALFGTDFLKQILTKFIKKKDLQFYQKEYLKPLQQIFSSNVPLGVKQYIVGGLSYFVNNYFPNIKQGWKIILAILCDSFEEDQDQIVKQKSYLIIKKIYQTNFSIIDLDENYVDYVQILGRMARQKDDYYIKGCLEAIKTIIIFYQTKLGINLENPTAPANEKLDIIFWQTMWLPLLSTIYGICGDFRADVQNQSIQLLFYILMRYGRLFKYEFWKMIMQGILRPTFQQITYTSQSKPLRKKQLEQWLRNSFTRLFNSINKLIIQYFDDFKLFLPDILKIYQSCIVSNSNKILTQLSTEALTQLLSSVGSQFQIINWKQYIQFIKTVLRKSWPSELESLQNWKKCQEIPEQASYPGKILTLNLIFVNCQAVIRKFSENLQQSDLIDLREIFDQYCLHCHKFNKNVDLRQLLWKNGFFQDMKSLPGLIRQEHEAIKSITLIQFKLIQKSQKYIDQYVKHALQILKYYGQSVITKIPKKYQIQLQQSQRQGTMLQMILKQNILPDLQKISLSKLIKLGYKQRLFKQLLPVCTQRTYCSKCNFCQFCQNNQDRQNKFTQIMKSWLLKIFQFNENNLEQPQQQKKQNS